MIRQFLLATTALALWAGVVEAQPRVKKVTAQPAAMDGRGMFDQYCAVCHGKGAKGDGPAAPALKKAPPDLTKISDRNGGVFPELKVSRYIQGLDEVESHGTRDMPMWGDVFKSLDSPDTAKRRVFTLVEHLKTLQTK